MVYWLKIHGLTIKITNVVDGKLDNVVGLGSESRTLKFEEFIDSWVEHG